MRHTVKCFPKIEVDNISLCILIRPVAATLSVRRSSGHEGSREESEVRRSPGTPFLPGCGGDTGPVGPAVVRFPEGAGPAAQ